MINLYGIAASNYTNCIKAALLEKNIAFNDITQFPAQEEAVLTHSPMGKVPYIETDGQFLSETNVIYDYLDAQFPEVSLYPDDAFDKARVKEIIRIVEHYLDAPARRHLGTAVFGQELNQAAFIEVRPAIENGLKALQNRAQFSPYVVGEAFTYADISSYFLLGFTNFHTKAIYDWDITETYPELGSYLTFIGQRHSISTLQPALEKALAEIIESSQ